MKITFGICTYNRKDILEKTILSLNSIDRINEINIRIYDDCSTDYDEEYLKKVFPTAKTIHRQTINVGADSNTAYMYKDFLKSGDDFLFNADSDLIYRKDIVNIIEKLALEGNEFFSLFNTPSHSILKEYDDFFVEKEHVGAAGCCLSKKLVEAITNDIKDINVGFDFAFSNYIRDNNMKVLVSKNSYVQHIGVNGYNSNDIDFDYGMNFDCDSLINAKIIEETFEKYILQISNFKDSNKFKIYRKIFYSPKNKFLSIKRKIKNSK